MQKQKINVGIVALLLVIGSALFWWQANLDDGEDQVIQLFGNVDIREAQLAFNGNEYIAAIFVQEGDHVSEGQLLARLHILDAYVCFCCGF